MSAIFIAIFHILCFFSLSLVLVKVLIRKKFLPAELVYISCIAVISLLYYGLFFVFVFSVRLGNVTNIVLHIAGLGSLIFYIFRFTKTKKAVLNKLLVVPAVLTLLFFCFYTTAFSGCRTSNHTETNMDNQNFCYIKDLPTDNSLAYKFSRNMHGNQPRKTADDWSVVDRPPIQVGSALSVAQFNNDPNESYDTYLYVSILLQLSWIGALFGLLVLTGLDMRKIMVILLLVGTSGFIFINSVFVWPKLYAASLVLLGLSMLFSASKAKRDRFLPVAILALTTSLLVHSGVVFTIVGALPVIFFDVFRPANRSELKKVLKYGLVGALVSCILLTPWLVYKNSFGNADRLVKWHFAGVISAQDTRSTVNTIEDSYHKLSLDSWLRNKYSNTMQLITPTSPGAKGVYESSPGYLARWLRINQFYITIVAVGIFNIGWLTLLSHKVRSGLTAFDKRVLLTTLFTYLTFVLLMFIPGSTVLHQGSYAAVLLLYAVLGTFISRLSIKLLLSLLAIQLITFIYSWVLVGDFRKQVSSLAIIMDIGLLLIVIVYAYSIGPLIQHSAQSSKIKRQHKSS